MRRNAGVLGIDPGGRLLDTLLMYREKAKLTPGKSRRSAPAVSRTRPSLSGRHAQLCRLQRHEEHAVGEAARIDAVVRPSVLGDDGLDLGEALDDAAHSVDEAVALVER